MHDEWLDYDQHMPSNNGLWLTAADCEIVLLRTAAEREDGEHLPVPQSDRRQNFYSQLARQTDFLVTIGQADGKDRPALCNVVVLYDTARAINGRLVLSHLELALPRSGSVMRGTASAWWYDVLKRPAVHSAAAPRAANEPPPLDIQPLRGSRAPDAVAQEPPPLSIELEDDDEAADADHATRSEGTGEVG